MFTSRFRGIEQVHGPTRRSVSRHVLALHVPRICRHIRRVAARLHGLRAGYLSGRLQMRQDAVQRALKSDHLALHHLLEMSK